MEKLDSMLVIAKMADKKDATKKHRKVPHVVEAEAEAEGAIMEDGAELLNKQPARASKAEEEWTRGQR